VQNGQTFTLIGLLIQAGAFNKRAIIIEKRYESGDDEVDRL